MLSIEVIHQSAVTGLEGRLLRGLCFDGRFLYSLSSVGKLAVRLDDSGRLREQYPTRRTYSSLCCDRREGGFWAVSRESPLYIFRLSPEFEEYDRLRITGRMTSAPTLVELDGLKEQLVIRADRYLMWISMSGEMLSCLAAPSHWDDFSIFGRHMLGAGQQRKEISLYNEYLGFQEAFVPDRPLPVTGLTALCHLPDKLVCSVLGAKSHRYNTLMQVVLSPRAALDLPGQEPAPAALPAQAAEADARGALHAQLTPFFGGGDMLEHIIMALINSSRGD